MRTTQKTLARFKTAAEDVPIYQYIHMIENVSKDRSREDIINSNMRIRIEHDTALVGCDDRETDIFTVSIISNEVMTEEELAEERLMLDKRKAEREAADRVTFDNFKKRYGWT